MSDLRARALAGVKAALVRVDPRIRSDQLTPDISLVDDLGIDSIRFVDLAVALEEALSLKEFPFQEWYDQEVMDGARFTVGSLVAACVRCLETV